ncbi:MAG: PKD domain-containing protein, partial [bacterium]|nr:PKD domain-containing protein [bacterium]
MHDFIVVLVIFGLTMPSTAAALIKYANVKLGTDDHVAFDKLGNSVALSEDIAVVGAFEDDDAGISSGSVYVFVRNGNAWHRQAKLTASDAAPGDAFGYTVAVSGETVVVGAFGNDDGGLFSGSVYVFVRTGNTWSEQAKLTANDATPGDFFGYAVAVSGNTIVVGAPVDSDTGLLAGSAYVFARQGSIWQQQQKLIANDSDIIDQLGFAVAVSGDTVLLGAFGDDDGGATAGSAYIFTRSEGVWQQQQKLVASDAAAFDQFGFSVALSGGSAVVGASGDSDAGTSSGSAYIFTRSGGAWQQQQKLVASDATAFDQFGFSVALSSGAAVVGANLDVDAGIRSGSAYRFVQSDGIWHESTKLLADNRTPDDDFGRSVAVWGATILIGAPGDDAAGTNAGAGHIFQPLELLSADAGGPYVGYEGDAIVLDTATASDPDGVIQSFNWQVESTLCRLSDPSLLHPTLICDDNGDFSLTLTVTDDLLELIRVSTLVHITNVAPEIEALSVPQGPVARHDQPVGVGVAFSDRSPTDVHAVRWAWGDGTSDTQHNVTSPAMQHHSYAVSGLYQVSVTVLDDDGASASAVAELVVNSPPLADAGGPYVGHEGDTIVLDTATASDPDGAIQSLNWQVESTLCRLSDPSLLHPTLICDDNGDFSLTLTVTDDLLELIRISTLVHI